MILDDSCKEALGQMKVTKVEDTMIVLDGHITIRIDEATIEHIMALYKKKEYPEYVIPIMYKGKPYDVTFKPESAEWDTAVLCEPIDAPAEYFYVMFNETLNTIYVYETAEVSGNEKDGYTVSLTGVLLHKTSVYEDETID